MQQSEIDLNLRSSLVEAVQHHDGLLDGCLACFGLCDDGSILCLLLLSLRINFLLLRGEGLYLGAKYGDFLLQLVQEGLQLSHIAVQLTDLLSSEVTLLPSSCHGLVAPSLLSRLIAGLLQQTLDQLLEQNLDLSEGILGDLVRQRCQHCALQVLPFAAQEVNNRLAAFVIGRASQPPYLSKLLEECRWGHVPSGLYTLGGILCLDEL